ncbi:hypothetical protein ACHAW5_009647 [Stephanodiscus triporus]|uniref:Magnesium transporter n=1 Tax=Stephanodiscus triporus TaxID=2934178 RepID=A0ABD3P1V3_9STRA
MKDGLRDFGGHYFRSPRRISLPHSSENDDDMPHHSGVSSHGTTRHDHDANSKNFAAGLHGERLHQMVVFELREDGSTAYFNMTLRSLYNSVVRTITDNCREANRETVVHNRQVTMQAQQWMRDQERGGSMRGKDGIDAVGRGPSIGPGHAIIVNHGGGEGANQEESGNIVGDTGPTPSGIGPSPNSPPITQSNFVSPHHSSSSTSSTDVGLDSPIKSNQRVSDDDDNGHIYHPLQQQHEGKRMQIARRGSIGGVGASRATYRERLGGYLHPRDMRRLVTPFSSSNEPQLIVRRHAMLLNFDPLRAIVLKDRLLVLVPDGADSILIALERRVRGGITEMTDQVFGGKSEHDVPPAMPPKMRTRSKVGLNDSFTEGEDYSDNCSDDVENDEWQDIQKMDWQKLPFELQSVDAILQTVTSMLMDDVKKVHRRAERAMEELRGDLRLHKDEVNLIDRRVQGFVRAINQVLDEDEDMSLMNLSRLLTHPERFMQPVSREILEEESDEPELILETYLQQALSIVNSLDLLKGQIMTTQEQISMTLDALRNRLLFINTLLSLAMLCVTIGAFIGALFGMNITNPLQDTPDSANFLMVVWVTSVTVVSLCGILAYIFYRVTNNPTDLGKKTRVSSVHFHSH